MSTQYSHLIPLKTSVNLWFSDIFRRQKLEALGRNELISRKKNLLQAIFVYECYQKLNAHGTK